MSEQTKCGHEWVAFSTAVAERVLMLECGKCHAAATVNDPTDGEWQQAFQAPSHPYVWTDNSRVTVRSEQPYGGYAHVTFARDVPELTDDYPQEPPF